MRPAKRARIEPPASLTRSQSASKTASSTKGSTQRAPSVESVRSEIEVGDSDEEDNASYLIVGDRAVCKICHPTVTAENFQATKFEKTGRGTKGLLFVQNLSARKRHTAEHTTAADTPKGGQKTLDAYCVTPFAKRDLANFLCSANLSFNFVENGCAGIIRREMIRLGIPANRRAAKKLIQEIAAELRAELHKRLESQSVFLGLDGGTILQKAFLNLTISAGPNDVYFHSTHKVKDLSAQTIRSIVQKTCSDLLKEKLFVIGAVSDNASAMTGALGGVGMADLASDGDSDEDPDNDDDVNDFDSHDIELKDEDAGFFFFAVRCWTHSLQLVFGDMNQTNAKVSCALACVERCVPLLKCRGAKNSLEELLLKRGKQPRTIHIPAVTRWNSYIKSMYQLYCVTEEANVVLGRDAVTQAEMYAMQIALIVLLPVCWASDETQSDSVSAQHGKSIILKLDQHISYVEKLEFRTTQALKM